MFNLFKRLRRTVGFANTCVAVEFRWGVCFAKAARRSGARHYDIAFWQEVADSFCAKWREAEPGSQDPARLLEQRLGVYLSFLRDTVLKEAECGNLTTAQLEQVGRFFARASVLDLQNAVLSQAGRTALRFGYTCRNASRLVVA